MPDIPIGPLRPDEAARCAELETVLFAGDSPWPASAFTPERHTRFFAARDETADGVPDRAAGPWIESGRRLVEKEDLWLLGESSGKLHSLSLPS